MDDGRQDNGDVMSNEPMGEGDYVTHRCNGATLEGCLIAVTFALLTPHITSLIR